LLRLDRPLPKGGGKNSGEHKDFNKPIHSSCVLDRAAGCGRAGEHVMNA
jgi:hypothetical protein